MIALAVACKAAALAIALARHVQDPFATRASAAPSQGLALIALVLVWSLLGNVPAELPAAVSDLIRGIATEGRPVAWYGWAVSPAALGAAFIGIVCGAGLLAALRIMRVALLYRCIPWGYAFVALVAIGYFAGFGDALDLSLPRAGIQFSGRMGVLAAALIAVYPALMFGRKDIVFLSRLRDAVATRAWRRALGLAPPWLAVLLLAVPLGIAAAAGSGNLWLILALFAFVLRDIGIAYAWHLDPAARRPDLAAFVTLIALYGLLPAVVMAAGARPFLVLFLPTPLYGALASFAIALAEAALVWIAIGWRWRSLRVAAGRT
jgi:hypothetical protein